MEPHSLDDATTRNVSTSSLSNMAAMLGRHDHAPSGHVSEATAMIGLLNAEQRSVRRELDAFKAMGVVDGDAWCAAAPDS